MGLIVTAEDDELFPSTGSVVVESMLAVFVAAPLFVGVMLTVIAAISLLASVPMSKLKTPLFVVIVPCDESADRSCNDAGNGSLTFTLSATCGPRLVTKIVKVTLLPMKIAFVEAIFFTTRSANG